MSFTQIAFLFGALAVVGPLLAHLLAKPRFRRIPFTMLRFLHAGQVESQSRRRLRDLLVLLLRCAIIVLIAMLFARPRLLTEIETPSSEYVYYLGLDDSMSMSYSQGGRSYIDELKDAAADYIKSAQEDSVFHIYRMGSGQWLNGLSKDAALAQVNRIVPKARVADVSEFLGVISRQSRRDKSVSQVNVFVCSDFAGNTLKQFLDVSKQPLIDKLQCKVILPSDPVKNAAITECHVAAVSDNKINLNATVVNYGQVALEGQITASYDRTRSKAVQVNIGPAARETYVLELAINREDSEGVSLPIEIGLSGGDGLVADDRYYLAVSLPRQSSINAILADAGKDEMFLMKTAVNSLSGQGLYGNVNLRYMGFGEISSDDLSWADVVICSQISPDIEIKTDSLSNFVTMGGKLVFFMTRDASTGAAKSLWDKGLLAAMPNKYIGAPAFIAARSSMADSTMEGSDREMLKSLSNYQIDKVVLKGYYQCKGHADSLCPWQLDNGFGFIYSKRLGNGTVVLVNTSSDDSLGGLTKSSASIAFCRYLLGQSSQIGEHCFVADEHIMLPASEMEIQFADDKQFWVQVCDGGENRAVVAENFLVVDDPGGTGWVKTLNKPIRYAGVNLPEGETDISGVIEAEAVTVVSKAFIEDQQRQIAEPQVAGETGYKSIWKIFAWILIALLLAEPVVTNRLKR